MNEANSMSVRACELLLLLSALSSCVHLVLLFSVWLAEEQLRPESSQPAEA